MKTRTAAAILVHIEFYKRSYFTIHPTLLYTRPTRIPIRILIIQQLIHVYFVDVLLAYYVDQSFNPDLSDNLH